MESPALETSGTMMGSQTERENPFNKFEYEAEVSESELMQQIKGYSEMSGACASIDKQTFLALGVDLSNETSLEDFVHYFDDKISRCFRVEQSSELVRRKRLEGEAGSDPIDTAAVRISGINPIWHSRSFWHHLLTENARPGVNGWHKPFSTQLYLRCLLKQRQRFAESGPATTTSRYSVSAATESTKALLDTRRRSRYDDYNADADENELRACFDLHSLITSELPCGFGEPFKSADEVLAEIDQLIQEGAGVCSLDCDANISPTALELLHFKEHGGSTAAELESSTFTSNLRNLSVGALSEYLEELEVLIRQLSEQLVQELADREEIDFERELKSEFISLTTTLQKQQKDALTSSGLPEVRGGSRHVASKSFSLAQQANATSPTQAAEQQQHQQLQQQPQSVLPASLSRLRKLSWSTSNVAQPNSISSAGASGGVNLNLFTQIPYHASNGPPDVELLQRFNQLLRAVVENHPNVPQLLTDYILNVYAPPADVQTTIKLN